MTQDQDAIEPQDGAGTAQQVIEEAVRESRGLDEALDIFDEDPDAEGEAEAEDAEQAGEDQDEDAETEPRAKGEEEATPKPTDQARNFEVVLEDGTSTDLELPEGAKLVFKGDKRTVEVTNMQDLVTFAQKGVFMERRANEFATTERKLTGQVSALQREVGARDDKLEQAERTLLRILFDPKALAEARKAAEPYRNPEVVEGRKAKAELERRKEQEEQAAVQEIEQASQEFWSELRDTFAAQVQGEDSEFPYLREDDAPAVVMGVWQAHETFREAVQQDLISRGVSEEEAVARANMAAVQWLAEEEAETLHSVMSELNGIYAERAGKRRGPGAAQENAQSDPKADPTRHNKRTQRKLDERRKQTLRGSGATPAGTMAEKTADPRDGATYGDVWNDIDREFDEFLKQG